MAALKKSKAFHAFKQKLSYFYDDIEMMDVLRTSVLRGELSDTESSYVLSGVKADKHKHLARRGNSEGSRQNTINHLRASLYSSFVKDLYEEVTEYLKLILLQASKNHFDGARIIGEHGFKIEAKTVLALGNWAEVCRHVTENVFQALESERSTLTLLKKMCAKLGLSVNEHLLVDALPYLEVRHFLVHADGMLSQEFKEKYPKIKANNGVVVLDYKFILSAYRAILALVQALDNEIIDKNVLMVEDLRT
ncbi:hypothetical protein [Pseudomonas fluorescens]|uniref:hypothetical protein n=1 Tax=Pseudomonas fluorescens TaxID=294 RepID=UPI001241D9FD|nr:hypothetical protein [Pseudomonas fluorescens]